MRQTVLEIVMDELERKAKKQETLFDMLNREYGNKFLTEGQSIYRASLQVLDDNFNEKLKGNGYEELRAREIERDYRRQFGE